MTTVNEAYGEYLRTDLTRMKGIDEFGCVLDRLGPLPDIVGDVLDRIHPTLARFAIAHGEIDVGIDDETVATMDGPAFHRARGLLESIEADDVYVKVDAATAMDAFVAVALNALILSRQSITARQMEVIVAYERHGTQTTAGDVLGIPQQAVSESLGRANYRQRRTIRESLREAMERTYA